MLSDSARREAERKRSEALIAQIAGTATSTTPARSGGLLLSSSERPPPRKLTDHRWEAAAEAAASFSVDPHPRRLRSSRAPSLR